MLTTLTTVTSPATLHHQWEKEQEAWRLHKMHEHLGPSPCFPNAFQRSLYFEDDANATRRNHLQNLDNVATTLSFQDSHQEERHAAHLRSLWHRRHFTMHHQWEKDVQKEWELHTGVVLGTSREIRSRLFGMVR